MIVTLTINGRAIRAEIDPSLTLLKFIREVAGLTGTKSGCENGECGACTVLLEGKPVRSCLILAVEVQGKQILTIESLAGEAGCLHPLQQAFIDAGAVQCGFCTPGMILAAYALLQEHNNPTNEQVKQHLGGHLCRCGTYESVIKAVNLAAANKGR